MPIPIWMDVDTGVDDAMAILLALASPELEVKGISTVCGNTDVMNATHNTLSVLALAKKGRVPVAIGASAPLFIPLETAAHVHGDDGLGGLGCLLLPEPTHGPIGGDAVMAMRRTLENSDVPVTLVLLGPLTNVALLLRAYPHVIKRIERIVLMGGGAFRGNSSTVAEFNIFVDPEAASIVFASGVPIVMAGLDVTMKAYITPKEMDAFAACGTQAGSFCAHAFRFYAKAYQRYEELGGGCAVHDPVTISYLLHPEWFSGQDAFVEVDINGQKTMGCTATDLRKHIVKEKKNAFVLFGIDRPSFVQLLLERVGTMGKSKG